MAVTRPGLPAPRAALLTLVHSSLLVSLAATSVAVTTAVLAGFRIEPTPLFVVFAATLLVYSLDRVVDLEADERSIPSRAAFTRRYGRLSLGLGALCYGLAVGLAVARDVPLAGFLAVPPVAALAYSTPTLGLKRVFLAKNLVVGIGWAGIPLGVGVYFGDPWRFEILALSTHVAAMITVAAVIFDVKDVQGDLAAGIRTVPNVYGLRATRLVSQAANVAVACAVVGMVAVGVLPTAFLVLLALHLYVGCYVAVAELDRTPLFYGFVVDGEHVFLAVVVLALDALGVLG